MVALFYQPSPFIFSTAGSVVIKAFNSTKEFPNLRKMGLNYIFDFLLEKLTTL
jgi:hypothetical protein